MTVIVAAQSTTLDAQAIASARAELGGLHQQLQQARSAVDGLQLHASYRDSARNLLSYLALRRHDLRPLQNQLSRLGLSSLGRCEAHVLSSVERVLEVLQRLSPDACAMLPIGPGRPVSEDDWLAVHTEALFRGEPCERGVRIMVTMPSTAASDYRWVRQVSEAGMDCQRINCAHDDAGHWLKMIKHARRAAKASGRPCNVMMDLAGPKLRTGAIQPAAAVLRLRPRRDACGRVTQPAHARLCVETPTEPDQIQVPSDWLGRLKVDDVVKCRDARGSRRCLRVTEVLPSGCRVELEKTTYVVPGLKLRRGKGPKVRVQAVGGSREQSIRLQEGDALILTRGTEAGRPAIVDPFGTILAPATLGCSLGAAFDDIRQGEPIWFDDGKIGGHVEFIDDDGLQVRITHAPGGAKLKSDKGINLPGTDLKLEALSADDLKALTFACQHADAVQLSFVNEARDVSALVDHLARLGALDMGVVLKIETRKGFANLPQMLLAGMRLPRLGVMIARGDLAIENGFERTAQLQEQILCLCEAAHVPVIWATQVLESLAKTGSPSRAEMTDAATASRAECVMLNKGEHILKAIKTLDTVLRSTQASQHKKSPLLRALQVAQPSPA
jgi:pyruvate kinase